MSAGQGSGGPQVGVYLDFDNIVRSRYDELHGRQSFRDDKAHSRNTSAVVRTRLTEAHLDLDSIIDFASSFGTVAISRAYADWSSALHASYATQTLRRSIDLVQLFPMTGTKNGADIRLAIDVIEDLSRYPDLSHVVVVAGDSDYVALAQRCKRLGRRVIGIGAMNSVGQYWQLACDEFRFYGNLPGIAAASPEPGMDDEVAPPPPPVPTGEARDPAGLVEQASNLMYLRAETEWLAAGGLKALMTRLDPTFDESTLGFPNFSSFLRSLPALVDVQDGPSGHLVRLHSRTPGASSTSVQSAESAGRAQPAPPPAFTWADLRHRLVSSYEPLTEVSEQVCVDVMRCVWEIANAGQVRNGVPRTELVRLLAERSLDQTVARWAAHTVMTSGLPLLVHDSDMLDKPNPELSSLTDPQLVSVFRRWSADRARNLDRYQQVTAEGVCEAVYGTAVPKGARDDVATALSLSSVGAMRSALGPRLVPAPVLWDVAEAIAGVGVSLAGLTAEAFAAAVSPGLVRLERDPETVPLDAAYLSISEAGLCAPNATAVENYAAAAAAILSLWIKRLHDGGHLHPRELTSMDAFYRLSLPDRYHEDWRAWIRDLVLAQTARRP